MKNTLVSLIKIAACVVLALGVTAKVQAQDKVNPVGTWQWTTAGRNGGPDRTNTLVLKLDGGAVKGVLTSPGRNDTKVEVKIEDVKVTGDEITFSATREMQGNKRTTKYNGKITATTIKGKIEFEGQNGTRSVDWEAKRIEDKK